MRETQFFFLHLRSDIHYADLPVSEIFQNWQMQPPAVRH